MISRDELTRAIKECEDAPDSYHNCQKLATFYNLYDHLYEEADKSLVAVSNEVIGDFGDSRFLRSVHGKNSEDVWAVLDDLMDTLSVVDDRLYESVMRKLNTL